MSSSPEKIRSVSRYEVLRQLAQGPRTQVFLAALRENQTRTEPLALELLRKELARDRDLRALFLAQAEATLSLGHPNIARAYAVVADTDACGLALEFVAGQSLAQLLERMGRSEIPLALHLRILCNVLAALHHIHQQPVHREPVHAQPARQHHTGNPHGMGLVHGDVSPSNVMLSYDGEVKVVGVGFAQMGAAKVGVAKAGVAKVGVDDLGSDVGYRAPELFLGYAPSPAADVYSVGVMLWEALARCRRSFGIDARAVARQRTRGEEPDIEHVSTDAPKALRAACRRALAVSRRDRFETALELEAEIETYLAEVGAPSAAAANLELAQLMRELFERERDEMQLFIGSTLGAAVPGAALREAPGALREAPDALREALDALGEAPDEQCSHAVSSAPPAESESGEHRAYSASLVHPPPVARRSRRRVWLIAAAALALASGVTARWVERARGTNDASARLALQSEQPPVASLEPATPAPLEAAPSGSAEATPPPTAFLDTAAGDVAASAEAIASPGTAEPPPAPPSAAERLAADEHRARLQDALVAAAHTQRARLARREAARRTARARQTASTRQTNTAPARQDDDDTAPLPSSTRPTRGPLPRAIDEIDPYGS